MENPLDQRAIWNAQALACLEAADTHRRPLLRLASGLTGSADAGKDLYQQTLLNCHDAIQRKGFTGTDYAPYLSRALRQAHYRRDTAARRFTSLPDYYEAVQEVETDDESRHRFAEQVAAAAQAQFAMPDRLMLRLHLEGESYRDISALVGGGDYSWIRRRLEKMKTQLRAAFGQAWSELNSG